MDLFLRICASFAVAGLWISGASFLAQRFGSKTGGLIANLPSNIVVSFLFIASIRGTSFASEAALAVPFGMAVNLLFLFVYVAVLGTGRKAAAPFCALGVWFLLALGSSAAGFRLPLAWALVLYAAVSAGLFAAARWILNVRQSGRVPFRFRPSHFLIRALIAGSAVGSAVGLSSIAPSYLSGIFTTFPAVLFSTMLILSLSVSPEFARASGTVMLISSGNIIAYALTVCLTFPVWGPWAGSAAAMAASVATVLVLRPLVKALS